MPWGSIGCVSGNAPILPKRSGSDELSGFQGGRSGERDRLPRQPHDIKRQTNQELRPRLRRNGWDRVSGSGGSPSRAGCAGSANPGGRGGGMATGADWGSSQSPSRDGVPPCGSGRPGPGRSSERGLGPTPGSLGALWKSRFRQVASHQVTLWPVPWWDARVAHGRRI